MRNYKLAKPSVWALYLIGFYFMPFTFIRHSSHTSEQLQFGTFDHYYNSFHSGDMALLFIFACVIMASLIIGQERSTHSTNFTFSLPVSRKDLFLSKWLFGVVHIAASLFLNIALSIAIYTLTVLNKYENIKFLLLFFIFAFFFLVAIYTFSLFVGTFCGNTITQFVFSFIFLFLPAGLLYLIGAFINAHWGVFMDHPFNRVSFGGKIAEYVTEWTLPIPLFQFSYQVEELYGKNTAFLDYPSLWAVPIIYTAAALAAGIYLFSRTKNENNGRILVFDNTKGFFAFSIAVCFALLGGAFFGDAFDVYGTPSLFTYYIGMAGAGLISYIAARKLFRSRVQFYKR
jgi:ABC-type transport system involved in multi-copper enzyme maturation permease subunit